MRARETLGAIRTASHIWLSKRLGAAEPPVPAPTQKQLDRIERRRSQVDTVRLREHVSALAGPRERRFSAATMAYAESYVADILSRFGWSVQRHPFPLDEPHSRANAANLTATRAGVKGTPTYLIGAHLDTVPGSPGADDNASGVACLLELARILSTHQLDHDLILAVFDEEETGLVGSRHLARQLTAERELAGVIVFESVGYFTDRPGTQRLPRGANLLYAGQVARMRHAGMRGDWTLINYRSTATDLATDVAIGLTRLAGPDSVILARDPLDMAIPGAIARRLGGLASHFARSDHKPFWDLGVPAVQLTDTANFRNPHYHQPTDIPDTLDYQRMADITAATAATLAHLIGIRD